MTTRPAATTGTPSTRPPPGGPTSASSTTPEQTAPAPGKQIQKQTTTDETITENGSEVYTHTATTAINEVQIGIEMLTRLVADAQLPSPDILWPSITSGKCGCNYDRYYSYSYNDQFN